MVNNEQARFSGFSNELAEISKKYGIVLQAIGGVIITDIDDADLKQLSYSDDLSSGDIYPIW